MKKYAISKYENANGKISTQQWISIHDIGQYFGNVKLTMEQYKKTEDSFVKIVLLVLRYMGIEECKINNIEKFALLKIRPDVAVSDPVKSLYNTDIWEVYDTIRNGDSLNAKQLESVIRLHLREDIWSEIYVPLAIMRSIVRRMIWNRFLIHSNLGRINGIE